MIAYFDCFSGISGDMTLGAFVDLGVPIDWLRAEIAKLPLDGYELEVSKAKRHGITGTAVVVEVKDHQPAREYRDIKRLIETCCLPGEVKARSLAVFERIADAEAQIHACSKEHIHFHEVGGVDAIVDIVGAALCMTYLKIESGWASKVAVGSGFVACHHGTLPVPAPATMAILKGVPVFGSATEAELVTPTGAAILRTFCDNFGALPAMTIDKIGYGVGQREHSSVPNLLRIVVGNLHGRHQSGHDHIHAGQAQVVEANVDDMNPEMFGYLMDKLFADGALDVFWSPVQMKKNRPGTKLNVLCDESNREKVIQRILTETTTTGVRQYEVQRRMLKRQAAMVETSYGRIRVKKITQIDGKTVFVPEFEICKQIAVEKKLPLKTVYSIVQRDIAR